jgi:hypothetical protein
MRVVNPTDVAKVVGGHIIGAHEVVELRRGSPGLKAALETGVLVDVTPDDAVADGDEDGLDADLTAPQIERDTGGMAAGEDLAPAAEED